MHVTVPGKPRIDDHGFWHARGIVALVEYARTGPRIVAVGETNDLREETRRLASELHHGERGCWRAVGVHAEARPETRSTILRRLRDSSHKPRRLADAQAAGCDLAVVTTAPGSRSQDNVMRRGFKLLYTRAVLVKTWD